MYHFNNISRDPSIEMVRFVSIHREIVIAHISSLHLCFDPDITESDYVVFVRDEEYEVSEETYIELAKMLGVKNPDILFIEGETNNVKKT